MKANSLPKGTSITGSNCVIADDGKITRRAETPMRDLDMELTDGKAPVAKASRRLRRTAGLFMIRMEA